MKIIKHIIFDLDGVLLVDSNGNDIHSGCFLQAIQTVIPEINITTEFHDTNLKGITTKEKLKKLAISEELSNKITSLKNELVNHFINNSIESDTLKKELCKTLVFLDYTLYCVSNSDRNIVEICLLKLGILDYFSGIISKSDVKETKPSPTPYLYLYTKFHLEPTSCLVLEDSPSGIESARLSGANIMEISNHSNVTLEKILFHIKSLNNMK